MLDQFLVALNEYGHALPPNIHTIWFDWARIHEAVRDAASAREETWPLPELYGCLALAQHHGIPTRLLDWSRSGRVAGFFAAERAAIWVRDEFPPQVETEMLAVWAYRESRARRLWAEAESAVILIAVPQDYNRNMRAQRGVFTIHTQYTADPNAPPVAHSLDDLVRDRVEEIGGGAEGHEPDSDVILREITLPVSQAPRLLRLLSYEGVTRASLFPSIDGVVQALGQKRLWG